MNTEDKDLQEATTMAEAWCNTKDPVRKAGYIYSFRAGYVKALQVARDRMRREKDPLNDAQFQVVQKANAEFPFPSDQEKTLVEVFYQKGDDPFVSGLHGCTNGDMIQEIEQILNDNQADVFDMGDGQYLYRASWEPDQTGEFGRVELPGYWDLEFIAFKPVFQIPKTVEEVAAFEATHTPPVITEDMLERSFEFILQAMRKDRP